MITIKFYLDTRAAFPLDFYFANDALSLDVIGYAREIGDRTYAQLSFRTVLQVFTRAQVKTFVKDLGEP